MYEIVSDMSTRQDTLEDRLTTMEDKLVALQEQLDLLPDLIASRIQAQVWFFTWKAKAVICDQYYIGIGM